MTDERFAPEERVTPREVVTKLIEDLGKKFRDTPRRAFVNEVIDALCAFLTPAEVETLIEKMPLKYERFPTMQSWDAEIKAINRAKWVKANPEGTAIKRVEPVWESKQAPGTPPNSETLFEMMKAGNTESGAFKFARSCGTHQHLDDADLWECYDSWVEGKVNPKLLKKPEDLVKDLFG